MMPPLNITATLINYTKNKFGDFEYSSSTALACHFREIDTREIAARSPHEEGRSDGMAWFEPTANVKEGSIILINDTGQYYRISRLTTARRLGEADASFLKADLEKFQGIS